VGGAGADVGVEVLIVQSVDLDGVVDAAHPDIHASIAVAQLSRVDIGVLEGLPRGFQNEPLLGVQVVGLLR
jgi:hypothetical protein